MHPIKNEKKRFDEYNQTRSTLLYLKDIIDIDQIFTPASLLKASSKSLIFEYAIRLTQSCLYSSIPMLPSPDKMQGISKYIFYSYYELQLEYTNHHLNLTLQ